MSLIICTLLTMTSIAWWLRASNRFGATVVAAEGDFRWSVPGMPLSFCTAAFFIWRELILLGIHLPTLVFGLILTVILFIAMFSGFAPATWDHTKDVLPPRIAPFIWAMRPIVCLFGSFLVIAGFHLQSSHLGFDDRWEMDMLAVTIFFALAATMLLNDFYDREADYKKGKDLAWKHPKFIRTFSLPQNPLE